MQDSTERGRSVVIGSHDFKRKSRGPSEFERRRAQHLLDELLLRLKDSNKTDHQWRGGELRVRQREWNIELYRVQPHPVHKDKAVRLPLALLQGNSESRHWKLYFRAENGHWAAYPDTNSEPAATAALTLHQVLAVLEADPAAVYW